MLQTTESLRSQIKGQLLDSQDADYQQAKMGFNLTFQQNPRYILIAQDVQDIIAAVRFAKSEGLAIAVQSTGHGLALPANDCLLIKTTEMTGVQIDAQAQTARIAAGTRWGKVLEAAQAHGLAPLLGSSPTVGAVGYTLGGGFGWLGRKYGLALDSTLAFEVVTMDGACVYASETENPDLFWALRGGGGGFGIVTALEIKLYPVTQVYGGNLFYPAEMAKEVFSRYADWIKDAPDELTSSVLVMNFPPIPAIPDFLRGKSFAIVRGCYAGNLKDGEAMLKFWREWQAPIIDDFKAMPFADVAQISNDPQEPVPGFSTSVSLNEINAEVIDIVLKHTSIQGSPLMFAEIRHAAGAVARTADNAYSHHHAKHLMQMVYMIPAPEVMAIAEKMSHDFKQDLAVYRADGVYMNFLEGQEKFDNTKAAYSAEKYQRLQAIKAEYDPENRLNHSFNIPPKA